MPQSGSFTASGFPVQINSAEVFKGGMAPLIPEVKPTPLLLPNLGHSPLSGMKSGYVFVCWCVTCPQSSMHQMNPHDNVCLYVVFESEPQTREDHHCVCPVPDNPHPYTGPTHTNLRILSPEQTEEYEHDGPNILHKSSVFACKSGDVMNRIGSRCGNS